MAKSSSTTIAMNASILFRCGIIQNPRKKIVDAKLCSSAKVYKDEQNCKKKIPCIYSLFVAPKKCRVNCDIQKVLMATWPIC